MFNMQDSDTSKLGKTVSLDDLSAATWVAVQRQIDAARARNRQAHVLRAQAFLANARNRYLLAATGTKQAPSAQPDKLSGTTSSKPFVSSLSNLPPLKSPQGWPIVASAFAFGFAQNNAPVGYTLGTPASFGPIAFTADGTTYYKNFSVGHDQGTDPANPTAGQLSLTVAAGSECVLAGAYVPNTTNAAGLPTATVHGGFSQVLSTQGLPLVGPQVQAIARLVASNGVVTCARSVPDPNMPPTYIAAGVGGTLSGSDKSNWPVGGIFGECTVTIGPAVVSRHGGRGAPTPGSATSLFLSGVSIPADPVTPFSGTSILDAPGTQSGEGWGGFVGYLDTCASYTPGNVTLHWIDVDVSVSCMYADPQPSVQGIAAFVDLRRHDDPAGLVPGGEKTLIPYYDGVRAPEDDNPLVVAEIALAAGEYLRGPPRP
jgi:hypothetical protein